MASDHTSDTSLGAGSGTSSGRERNTSDDAETIQHRRGRNSDDATKALAEAAANSPLAQKLKDRDPVEVIDKPTQEFRRKRKSSASPATNQKSADDGRHDSAGLVKDLKPLTPAAADVVRGESPGSSRESNVQDEEEKGDEVEVQFRKDSIFRERAKAKKREGGGSSVDPKEPLETDSKDSKPGTPEENAGADAGKTAPLLQPKDRPEGAGNGQAGQQQPPPFRYVQFRKIAAVSGQRLVLIRLLVTLCHPSRLRSPANITGNFGLSAPN